MAQKVWVFTDCEFVDGEISVENQIFDNFEQAEVAFNERMADICFYLEDEGILEDANILYEEEDHYWEMRHNDDIVCLLIEEQEIQS